MKPLTLPEPARAFLVRVAVAVTCGALGGFCIGIGVPVFAALGLPDLLGVAIHPQLTKAFLYSKIVWGGIWDCLLAPACFLMPWSFRGPLLLAETPSLGYITKGCALGALGPGLVQLFVVFPLKDTPGSIAGLSLGVLTPLLVLFFNAVIWGIPSNVLFTMLMPPSQQTPGFISRPSSEVHDVESDASKDS